MKTIMMDCSNKRELRNKFLELGASCKEAVSICPVGEECCGREGAFLAGEAFAEGSYCFNKEALKDLNNCTVFESRDELTGSYYDGTPDLIADRDLKEAFLRGIKFGRTINYARTLGNIPSNFFHIDDMVDYINSMSKKLKIECRILRKAELTKLGCNGILSVNAASNQEAAVAILKISNGQDEPLNALVGKGVMYDSGGMVLKDMKNMFGMKFDMCGAATILEIMEYIKVSDMRINVVAVIPIVENCIGPCACRPGDVITMHSGKSVEIYNTDAEGRLILADALSLAVDEGAQKIIDLATLTNSCREALGDYVTGVFSNDENEYTRIKDAADEAGELIWRLPLMDIYSELVSGSDVADLINYAPGEGAGASFAACFLEKFIPAEVKWVHLDCVGPAVRKKKSSLGESGATGVMAGSILRELCKEEL